MERWLALRLAERHGIWANPQFLFPRRLLERVLERVLESEAAPSPQRPSPFAPEVLTWAIFELLPARLGEPAFAELDRYLVRGPDARGPEARERRELALARRIGQAFDDYAVYRPEQVRAWELGAQDHWQAQLWRALVERHGAQHVAARVERLIERLKHAGPGPGLPARIHLFALPSLPPLFRAGFEALGRWLDVHHYELELPQLAELRPGDAEPAIGIHSCAGPLREVEVLRDQILGCFDEDPSLEPGDVAILTPDIELYAPLVDTVFGEAELPVHALDLSARARSEWIAAFLGALRLLRSRLTSAGVLDLLAAEPVRGPRGLEAADLERLRALVDRAGVRWGADAQQRREADQPPVEEHTWRFGLDRLLLGYAQPARGGAAFKGVEPCEGVDAEAAALAGELAEFVDTLVVLRAALRAPRPVQRWRTDLEPLIGGMFGDRSQDAEAARSVRDALETLSVAGALAGCERPLALESLIRELEGELGRDAHLPAHALLGGAIAVAPLAALRGIPFRVVALCGLGAESFPRADHRPGFDYLRESRPGDPSRREEDRELFRAALGAARDRVILTYPGQSPRDGARLAPSVVVDELLAVRGEQGAAALVLEHPLHSHDARYFHAGDDPRWFSFDARACALAQALQLAPLSEIPFCGPDFRIESEPLLEVELEALSSFLRDPARAFLRGALGIRLAADAEPLPEREPLALGGLERWGLSAELLADPRRDADPAAVEAVLRSRGLLPPGALGQYELGWSAAELRLLPVARALECAGPVRGPLDVDLELGGTRLVGQLGEVRERGLLRVQASRLGGRAELDLWLEHLVLNALRGPHRAWLVGRPALKEQTRIIRLDPPRDARALLEYLLKLFAQGQGGLLPLYPRASRAYAASLGKGVAAARAAAGRCFWPDPSNEASDTDQARSAYLRLLTRGIPDPFDEHFAEVALGVFEPLLGSRRDEGPA
jgi:exodeoxyribonuclease V gamma subunit